MPAPLIAYGAVTVGTLVVTGVVAWMGITFADKAAESFGREAGKGAADAARIAAIATVAAIGYYAVRRTR